MKLKCNTPKPSWRKGKKRVVLACKGNKQKIIHYGAIGYEDYTMHKDPIRRKNYLTRSAGIKDKAGKLTKDNIFSANYWARRDLW